MNKETKWIVGFNCIIVLPTAPKKDVPRPVYVGPRGYLCPFCGEDFAGYIGCAKHMGMYSYNGNTFCKPLIEGKAEYKNPKCPHCKNRYKSFERLAKHLQGEHSREAKIKTIFAAKRTEEIHNMGRTIKQMADERGIGGKPNLRGQDVPKGTSKVSIKVDRMYEAKESFKSPFIIDLVEPLYGREAFAVNITNLRRLAIMHKMNPETADTDELCEEVKGKTLTLFVCKTNNPQKNKDVYSLFFNKEDAQKIIDNNAA